MENVVDEIHFLLYRPAIFDLRLRFLLPIVQIEAGDPLSNVFSNDICAVRYTATYLYKSFQRRSEAMSLINSYKEVFGD